MKGNYNLVEWSMRKRHLLILLTALLVAAGIAALIVMPKQEVPEFTIRQGVVVGIYPGANSLKIEQQLTKPLEQYLFTFSEVNREKTCSKSQDGISYIFVELADDVKDKNIVWSKIKHGLVFFKSQLPSGVAAVIANDNFGDVSSLLLTLQSDDKTYRELDGYANLLEDRLRCVTEVANVRRYGSQKEQITLYVDNDKLNAYGIGQKTLATNLLAQNFTTSSGKLENEHTSSPIHIAESYLSEQEIADQIIFADPQGNVVRVKDIARVVREYPEPESYVTYNSKKCLVISVEVQHEANIIEFGKKVEKVLTDFENELPNSMQLNRIADQPKVVSDSINTFMHEFLIAIVAVILLIMVLLPFRVAVVAAIAIPISIAISLLIMFAAGIPLNMVTLAALILVLGIIVDDSVVIVDNYIDKLEHGTERWSATVVSATEYLKSIITATLAISITFIPFVITTSGQTRDFLLHFPWTICITLGISLFVSVMIIPIIQYFFIKKGLNKEKKSILYFVQKGYEKLLQKTMDHPKITVAVGLASVVVGVFIFTRVPLKMYPVVERDSFAVEIYLPEGSPLSKTAAVCDSLEHILLQDARVKSVTAFKGESSPRFYFAYAPKMPSKAYGQFIVNAISKKAAKEILDEYATRYAFYFPEACVKFKQMDFEIVEAPVELIFTGENIADLKQQGDKMCKFLNSLDECLWVRTSFDLMQPGTKIELDPLEAGRLGINKTTTSFALLQGLSGTNIATLWEDDYAMPVRLQPENSHSPHFGDIADVKVLGMLGTIVPLRQVATITPEWTEGQITHINGLRTLSVWADVRRDANFNTVYKKMKPFVEQEILPQLPEGISFEYGGMPRNERETLIPLSLAVAIAVIMIFLILIFHCSRLKIALMVMLSITLAAFGAAFGVWLMGIEFSLTGMLGIVTLFGIIVRNGIIMFDYIEKLRIEQHLSIKKAAFEAGKRRMRPIFLTSVAASMGVLPMIISQNPFWSPLGTVICFGSLISMGLIVTVLPAAYWLVFKC